jgi:hypothetical protein
MPIVWIREDLREDQGITPDNKEGTVYLTVRVSHYGDSIESLLLERPQYLPGQPHPNRPGLRVKSHDAKRDPKNGLIWHVQVSYDTQPRRDREIHPLERPTKWSSGSNERRMPALEDAEGKPCVNTAGDLYDDPPLERNRPTQIMKFRKNVPASLPPWFTGGFEGKINADTVFIRGLPFDPQTLLLEVLSLGEDQEEEYEGEDVLFAELSGELWFRPDGWKTRRPSIGWRERIVIESVQTEEEVEQLFEEWLLRRGFLDDAFSSVDDLHPTARQNLYSLFRQNNRIPEVGASLGTQTILREILVGDPPQRPSAPVFLDADGKAFRDDVGNLRQPEDHEIVWQEFALYESVPFASLEL